MNIQEFIKPELLIVVPFLYIAGAVLKAIQTVSDRYIPLILGILGIAVALLYIFGTTTVESVQQGCMIAFTALTQGVICAGVAVYTNQIKKQAEKEE